MNRRLLAAVFLLFTAASLRAQQEGPGGVPGPGPAAMRLRSTGLPYRRRLRRPTRCCRISGGLGPRKQSARARPSPPPPGWFAILRPRLLEPALPRRCRLLSDRAFMTLLEPRQQRSRMRRVSPAPAMRPLLRLRLPARPRCPRQPRARTPRRRLRRRLCRPPRQTRRRPM